MWQRKTGLEGLLGTEKFGRSEDEKGWSSPAWLGLGWRPIAKSKRTYRLEIRQPLPLNLSRKSLR